LLDVIVHLLAVLEVGWRAFVRYVSCETLTALDASLAEHTVKFHARLAAKRSTVGDLSLAGSFAD
jgi:hypothetical protein